MMPQHSFSPQPKRWNGHRRVAPVEPLSARIFRLRIARGYSVHELAQAAGILACTIQRLESGKSVDLKGTLRIIGGSGWFNGDAIHAERRRHVGN